MQGLRKGEWSAITKVKVFSPEICLVALGQGFLHLEASSAARDSPGWPMVAFFLIAGLRISWYDAHRQASLSDF